MFITASLRLGKSFNKMVILCSVILVAVMENGINSTLEVFFMYSYD